MRFYFFLLITMVTALANAGALENCQKQENDLTGFNACIEAERNRSANLLRTANQTTLEAVHKKTRETGYKTVLHQFRKSQARHVRYRTAHCVRYSAGNQRLTCQTDLNNLQITRLRKFAE